MEGDYILVAATATTQVSGGANDHELIDCEAWVLRSGAVTFARGEFLDDRENGR